MGRFGSGSSLALFLDPLRSYPPLFRLQQGLFFLLGLFRRTRGQCSLFSSLALFLGLDRR